MNLKRYFLIPTVFISVFALLMPSFLFSEETNFTVRVFYKNGNSEIIHSFVCAGNTLNAYKDGGEVKILFSEIKTITVSEVKGKNLIAEIILSNGKKGVFETYAHSVFYGKSDFGAWSAVFSNLSKIDFTNTQSAPAGQPSGNYDNIIMKNGDAMSGTVKNASFTLKTSYGDLKFSSSEIKAINFEGGGQNIDKVFLKNNDTFSGVVQENNITFALKSGTDITLEKDKVKDINFKE